MTIENIHTHESLKLFEENTPFGIVFRKRYALSLCQNATLIFVFYKVYIGFMSYNSLLESLKILFTILIYKRRREENKILFF